VERGIPARPYENKFAADVLLYRQPAAA